MLKIAGLNKWMIDQIISVFVTCLMEFQCTNITLTNSLLKIKKKLGFSTFRSKREIFWGFFNEKYFPQKIKIIAIFQRNAYYFLVHTVSLLETFLKMSKHGSHSILRNKNRKFFQE